MATTTPPRSSIFALDKWPLLLALSLFGCPNENTGEDEVGGLPGGLVITEVMADPEGADDGLEWFEIHNASSEAIDLAGFDLIYSKLDGTGRKSHTIARSLTIEHPVLKTQLTFVAPLPEHMARTWKLLDWKEDDVPADPFEVIR